MDFEYPFSISGELPSRPKPADTPKSGSDSSNTSSINSDRAFPPLKGISPSKLHELYVANEAELTKHISAAAGATEIIWGNDQWFLRWYEAASAPSSSSSQGTTNGAESHSLVKHASIPSYQIGSVVDVVLSRFQSRRLGWVVGPSDDPDQGLLEVVLINRGLCLEDEQPIMVIDLEKVLAPPPSVGSSVRSSRIAPRSTTASVYGSRLLRMGATSTAPTTVTATSTGTSACYLDADVHADDNDIAKSRYVRTQPPKFSRMRLSQRESQQHESKPGLADYQLQLMLLVQQNKKRLMMQREPGQVDSELVEQQNKEKLAMRERMDHLRIQAEESKRRSELWKPDMQIQEMGLEPLKEKRETDSTRVRQTPRQVEHIEFAPPSGHALADYNLQLMLLEQVSRQRLMMVKQMKEDDTREKKEELGQLREKSKVKMRKPTQVHSHHGKPEYDHYETLDVLPEQRDSDTVYVEREDVEQGQKLQQRKPPYEPVETGVGAFHPIEKNEGEPDDDIDNQYCRPKPSPLPAPSAPERKCHIFHNGIMVMLLVSPLEVEDWVRTWAHEADGSSGEADIAHWTGVYRTVLSTLPSSQFAMYIARDISRSTDNLVGTGYLHLHAGVAAVHGITVLPKYRRHGIGSSLVKYGMKVAHDEGAKIAMLTATWTGSNVFRRLGFRDFGRVKLYTWRPNSGEAAAFKEKELKANAEEEGWDWVCGSS